MMSCEFATVRVPAGLLALRSGRGRPSPMMPLAVGAKKKPAATISARCACASSRRDDAEEFSCNGGGDGWLVDEGMGVLRRRIHEMEAAQRGGLEPPRQDQECAEWYPTYADADACRLLLLVLQSFLANSPPGGVAVGLVVAAVLLLAVPASAFLLVKLLIDASRAIISNLHH